MHWIERDGVPVAVPLLIEWALWMEQADRSVKIYNDPAGWDDETMVFGHPEHDNWSARYRTRADAIAGHERVVRVLVAGGVP